MIMSSATTTLLPSQDFTTQPTAGLKDPFYCKAKLRKAHQPHEYVVPSKFATIPQNPIQSRIIRSAHHSHHRKRLCFPPAIKEESNVDGEDDDTDSLLSDADSTEPNTPTDEEENDEDMPLALLAYKKGYVLPNKADTAFPLIQHIPSHSRIHYPQQSCLNVLMSSNNHIGSKNSSRLHHQQKHAYPVPVNPVYAVPQHQYAFHTGGFYSDYNNAAMAKPPSASLTDFSQQAHLLRQRKYSYSSTSSSSVSSTNSSISGSVPSYNNKSETSHRSR